MKETKIFPPINIKVVSDGNELVLVEVGVRGKTIKDVFYKYSYTKSKTKLDSELLITETELKKQIANGMFI